MQPSASPANPAGRQGPSRGAPNAAPTGSAPGILANAHPSTVQAGAAPKTSILPSDRAAAIASKDSPLMQQAERRGKALANQRGLLNTSLAGEAAQNAVLDRATQLATADSQTLLQSRSLDLEQRRIDVDERIRDFRNNLDQRRLELDEGYRQKALAQEKELEQERFEIERDRVGVAERELDIRDRIESGRLSLSEAQFEFAKEFDTNKFNADEAYRQKALGQAGWIAEQQINQGLARLQLDKLNLSLTQQRFVQEIKARAYEINQNYNMAILQNPNLSGEERSRRLVDAYKEATAWMEKAIQIEFTDVEIPTLPAFTSEFQPPSSSEPPPTTQEPPTPAAAPSTDAGGGGTPAAQPAANTITENGVTYRTSDAIQNAFKNVKGTKARVGSTNYIKRGETWYMQEGSSAPARSSSPPASAPAAAPPPAPRAQAQAPPGPSGISPQSTQGRQHQLSTRNGSQVIRDTVGRRFEVEEVTVTPEVAKQIERKRRSRYGTSNETRVGGDTYYVVGNKLYKRKPGQSTRGT